MNDVAIRYELPVKFDDVASFAIIAQEKLKSVRAEISAIQRLGLAQDVLKQKIQEAQQIAEVKTRAEMRLGELTAAMPKATGTRTDLTSPTRAERSETKAEALARVNISTQKASQYELMAAHPDVVEQAIAEARENDDIVSRSLVLNKIKEQKRAENEAKREEARQQNAEKVQALSNPLDAQGLFQTIVIDPAWDWGDEGDVNQFGRAKPDYHTMSIDEVEALPIGKIAYKNCHIYLWITNRSLPKGFRLLEAWGFRYVTCLTWVKPSIGMGNYFRGSTEQILFGVKGSQNLKRHDVGTHFEAPRGERHSAKPDEFYSLVESCSYAPYIDIFGRKERTGWTVWGEGD